MDDRPTVPGRTRAQRTGDAAERLVADRLGSAGWTIVARNVHVGRHELDLVAIDPGPPRSLVVIEVRWRTSRAFGLPEETVDHRKRMRIRTATHELLARAMADGSPLPRLPLRYDLIVMEPATSAGSGPRIRHHRAAF